MAAQYYEIIAAVAIGVLSAIFISAFVILIAICRRQKLYYRSKQCENFEDMTRPEIMLIGPDKLDMELGDVQLNFNLEKILADDQWIDDATGLIPHCLTLLKTCRTVTERLTGLAMGALHSSGNGLTLIVESARKISSRVDDMVQSMYPPLDSRLLEARAVALTLAVTHLATITRYECQNSSKTIPMKWIDAALDDMEKDLVYLRSASMSQDTAARNNMSIFNSNLSMNC